MKLNVLVGNMNDRELRRIEARLRVKWQAWNKTCHPEDQIDWIEFYEEAINKKVTW